MARLYTSGWEVNEAIANQAGLPGSDPRSSVTTSVASVSTSTVRSGTYAGQVTRLSTDADLGYWQAISSNPALSTTYYARFYFYVTALPATATMTVGTFSALNPAVSARLTTGGKLQLWDDTAAAQVGSDSAATMGTNSWYRIELSFVTNASTQSTTGTLQLDGTQVATGSLTAANQSGSPLVLFMGCVNALATGNAMTINLDDVAINDSTGASQTSFPGVGSVVLLRPTADSAKGTGWTNDAAGASNFFDAVDNEPPQGIADTSASTGLHQIRNATSNANSSYDATMTTYTAAAVTGTVNVVVPIVVTAAPVVTSAKAGTVGVVSNPAITNIALGAGGTSGAFWSGTTGGTYPTGWKLSFGTTTYAPSVTLGTAPVMRITQVTSSTRIAVVCFMGMYVDYTPTVLSPPDLGLGLTVT